MEDGMEMEIWDQSFLVVKPNVDPLLFSDRQGSLLLLNSFGFSSPLTPDSGLAGQLTPVGASAQ